MRSVRFVLLIAVLACVSALSGLAGEYRLANGNTLKGELASWDEDGLVVKLDVGEFSSRQPWVSFSQETLRDLAKDPKIAPLVEPFIELRADELKARETKKQVVVRDVPGRVERPAGRPSLLAGMLTPIGLLLLGVLLASNLYAAYEVAVFRQRPPALVIAVSLILPIAGPILFLALPGAEAPAPAAPTAEEEAAAAAALTVPTGSDKGGGSGLSLAAAEKTAAASAHAQPQIYSRGDNTFNRRFFETKFPGFFRMVIGEAERDLLIVIRTPKNEFVGKRISRISMNELHLVLLSNNSEMSIAFGEITTVILKHKDAKV